jgi:hypothetical protein
MKWWTAARCIACAMLIFLCIPPLAADNPAQRTISPEGDPGAGVYSVTLILPPGQVWGVEETFSPGISFEGSGLPDNSYRYKDHQLDIALVDSSAAMYRISVHPGETGEISGTIINMITGEKGSLPSARISADGTVGISETPGTDPGPGEATPSRGAPLSPVFGLLATGIAGAAVMLWRRFR